MIDAHRPRDILELLFSGILKVHVELAAHLPIGVIRDADAAGLGDAFEPCGNVHGVAEDVTFLDHDVADMDAHAEFDALIGPYPRIALRHCALLLDRAAGRVHRTAELDQNAVAGALDDAATMFRDRRLQQFTAVSVEPGECSFLVDTHEPAIAGDIPRQNGRKPPLDTLFGHRHAPPRAFH